MSKKKKTSTSPAGSPEESNGPVAEKLNFYSEQTEPRAGKNPIPMFLVILMGILAFASDMHLMANRGGFDARIYQPYANLDELQGDNPIDPVLEKRKLGKRLYDVSCIGCHQANGLGIAGQFPPLAGSDWVNAEGPNRIIRIVLNGLQGPVNINGTVFNGPVPMSNFGALLSDNDVAAILTYIRSEWGNAASAVTEAQVKGLRDECTKRGATAWTADDLLKFPVK